MALRRARTPKDPEGRMPLQEHLLELRRRLMLAAGAVVLGSVVGWILYPAVYEQLTYPFEEFKRSNPESLATLNFGTATSAFSTQVSLSIWTGIIVSSPLWLWQLWAFVLPGLTRREKRIAVGVFASAVPLFLGGCLMAYLTLPKALLILFSFTPEDDKSSNIQQADNYFTFVTRFILAFGAAWLLPVLLVGLCGIGILSGRRLLSGWRVAVLLIFIASAVITPTPDPFTMFLMAGPLTALYGVATAIGLLIDRRRAAREGAEPDWSHLGDDVASPIT